MASFGEIMRLASTEAIEIDRTKHEGPLHDMYFEWRTRGWGGVPIIRMVKG
jgi:hypothetical protein